MIITNYVVFHNGNQFIPCCDPDTLYKYQLEKGYDPQIWVNKANSFINTLGPSPSVGYFLLTLENLNKLNITGDLFTVTFGTIDEAGQPYKSVILPELVITKAINLTPGLAGDLKAVYLVEVMDRRKLAKNKVIDLQINVISPDPTNTNSASSTYNYYISSLDSGAKYTWESAIETIWNSIGLQNYPGLPYEPEGEPEGFQFIGHDGYDALNILLAKIHCALRYNNVVGVIDIVRIGEEDLEYEEKIALFDPYYLIHNDEIVENNRTKLYSKVVVYFHKRYKYYGQEIVTQSTADNFVTSEWHSIELPTLFEDAEGNSALIIWDDLTAEIDINGDITNLEELTLKATEIKDSYKAAITTGGDRLRKVYSCPLDFIPGSRLKSVAYYNLIKTNKYNSGGIITEIVRHHHFTGTADTNLYSILKTSENLMPPDFQRHTYPYWFPQMQLLRVTSATPTQDVYTADVKIVNPETLAVTTVGTAYFHKNDTDSATLSVGTEYFGKIIGTKNVGGTNKPLYTVIDNTLRVLDTGVLIGTRPALNFIDGSNITINVADNSANNRIDVTIAATGSSSFDLTVQTHTGSPSYTGTSTIQVNTAEGLKLTQPSANTIRIGLEELNGDVTGTITSNTAIKIQNNPVKAGTPSNLNVLTYITANNRWEWQAAGIVVEDWDSSPTYTYINTIRVDTRTGLTLTQPTANTVLIGMDAVYGQKNTSGTVGPQTTINFIESGSVTINVADNSGNSSLDVTIGNSSIPVQPPSPIINAVLRTIGTTNGISTFTTGATSPPNAGYQAASGIAYMQAFNLHGSYAPGILWDLDWGGDTTVPFYNIGADSIPANTEVLASWTWANGSDSVTGDAWGWTVDYRNSGGSGDLTVTDNTNTVTGTSTITVAPIPAGNYGGLEVSGTTGDATVTVHPGGDDGDGNYGPIQINRSGKFYGDNGLLYTPVGEIVSQTRTDASDGPSYEFRRSTTSGVGETSSGDKLGTISFYGTNTDPTFVAKGHIVGRQSSVANEASITIYTDQTQLYAAIDCDSDSIGFFNTTPVAQQTITGSRSGNAALASLLTGLDNEGLIVDSTTAGTAIASANPQNYVQFSDGSGGFLASPDIDASVHIYIDAPDFVMRRLSANPFSLRLGSARSNDNENSVTNDILCTITYTARCDDAEERIGLWTHTYLGDSTTKLGKMEYSGGDDVVRFTINDITGITLGSATDSLGFFSVTPVVQPTSGADLTNNVTAGGTNDQIDDFTDLSVYANDAAAIRNAIYQLTRKLKQINDGLRDLGLFS